MRKESLLCHVKKAFKYATTGSKEHRYVFPNLTHGLKLDGIDQVWVADITYIRLQLQFVYLAVVLDRFSRKIIGWALATHMEPTLTLAALEMALRSRRPRAGEVIHHSDRGSQYACSEYVERLRQAGFLISMSKRGSPYDNAAAESFMKTLKQEEVHLKEYETVNDVKKHIPHFLERVYNRERLHSSLGYQTPEEFEQNLKIPKFRARIKNQEIGAFNLIP
jgi:putative transposase